MKKIFGFIIIATMVGSVYVTEVSSSEKKNKQESQFPQSVLWGDETFTLTWRNYNTNFVILEYLPKGHKTKNFKHMITIHISSEKIKDAIKTFIEKTKPYRTEEARIFTNDETGEIMVDVLLFDKENDIVEHNLVKFVSLKKGKLLKVFFHTRLKLSEVKKNNKLMKTEIGDFLNERRGLLYEFQFPLP
ncbi:MAG: hypothetical protein ABUK01_06690 [Leptospirales bacterium]